MRVRPFRRVGVVGGIAGVAVFAGLAGAGAVTVGQTGATVGCGTAAAVQTAVSSGTSYVVPSGKWTITSWSAQGGSGGAGLLALVVFRPTGTAHQYTIVGSTAAQTLTAGVLNTTATKIKVEGGDLIGIWCHGNGNNAAFGTPSSGDTFDQGAFSSTAPPSAGDTLTLGGAGSQIRMNVSVTLKAPSTISSTPTPAPQPAHIAICTAKPFQRADGTMGTFADVLASQYPTTDTSSPYYGAAPANYLQGVGLTCDLPPGYTDAGYKVNGDGIRAPAGYESVWVAPYEYYTKNA